MDIEIYMNWIQEAELRKKLWRLADPERKYVTVEEFDLFQQRMKLELGEFINKLVESWKDL